MPSVCLNAPIIKLQIFNFVASQAAATLFLAINEKKTYVKQKLLKKNNADHVIENSGNGKHGIMENDQETILSNENSPTTNAEQMQSSSDEESDIESKNEPAEKAQKAEIETTNDKIQEKSVNANPEKNVVPFNDVVPIFLF